MPVFSYNLRYIIGIGLVEMSISTNPMPMIYRNLYKNTAPERPEIPAFLIFDMVVNNYKSGISSLYLA